MAANRLSSRNRIVVGQRLRLPGAPEPVLASAPAVVAEPAVVTAQAEAAPQPGSPATSELPVAPAPAPEPTLAATPSAPATPPAPEPAAPPQPATETETAPRAQRGSRPRSAARRRAPPSAPAPAIAPPPSPLRRRRPARRSWRRPPASLLRLRRRARRLRRQRRRRGRGGDRVRVRRPALSRPLELLRLEGRSRHGPGRRDARALRRVARGAAELAAAPQPDEGRGARRDRPHREARLQPGDAGGLRAAPPAIPSRAAGGVLRSLRGERHRGARAEEGRIALVPRQGEVRGAALAAAPVQPRSRLRLAARRHPDGGPGDRAARAEGYARERAALKPERRSRRAGGWR